MGRKKNPRPSYLIHKPSGQARVRINGQDIYLGQYDSAESWQKYHELMARFPTPQSRVGLAIDPGTITVAELVARYVEFANGYYSRNGDERYRIKAAISPLIELFSSLSVDEFSPKKLRATRQRLIDRGNARTSASLSRKYVNQLTGVMIRIFKWGVAEELVPVTVLQALLTVDSLRKGRTGNVRESIRVKPVDEKHITPVLGVVPPEIAAMIQLQSLTGMRPDEVTVIRPRDLQMNSDVWVYTIASRFDEDGGVGSKTDYLEDVDEKQVLLGPQAQEILMPWIAKRGPGEFLFNPREVANRHGGGSRSRPPRERYDDESYCQAVQRGCRRAGVPVWTPGRLRHNAGTRIRKEFGAEAARLVLGHRHLSTTEIYAERDHELYRSIAIKTG
jgi:integrase